MCRWLSQARQEFTQGSEEHLTVRGADCADLVQEGLHTLEQEMNAHVEQLRQTKVAALPFCMSTTSSHSRPSHVFQLTVTITVPAGTYKTNAMVAAVCVVQLVALGALVAAPYSLLHSGSIHLTCHAQAWASQ